MWADAEEEIDVELRQTGKAFHEAICDCCAQYVSRVVKDVAKVPFRCGHICAVH